MICFLVNNLLDALPDFPKIFVVIMKVILVEICFAGSCEFQNFVPQIFILIVNYLFTEWIFCRDVFFKEFIPSSHRVKQTKSNPGFVLLLKLFFS